MRESCVRDASSTSNAGTHAQAATAAFQHHRHAPLAVSQQQSAVAAREEEQLHGALVHTPCGATYGRLPLQVLQQLLQEQWWEL